MAKNFTKITSNDTLGKGVTGLPDAPGLASGDMQKKFDELSKDVIIPKFNQLVDELDEAASSTETRVGNMESTISKMFELNGTTLTIHLP